MTTEELTELVKRTLYEVAPDLKGEPMDSNLRWNDQFEFDLMDFQNFITGLHRATGLALLKRTILA